MAVNTSEKGKLLQDAVGRHIPPYLYIWAAQLLSVHLHLVRDLNMVLTWDLKIPTQFSYDIVNFYLLLAET